MRHTRYDEVRRQFINKSIEASIEAWRATSWLLAISYLCYPLLLDSYDAAMIQPEHDDSIIFLNHYSLFIIL
jgi:hypothetical protein